MWLPRYAYNEQGEILHIKQGYSVAGSWTMPEIFAYETDKMDFSLAGVWVEYNPLSSTNEVTTKINNMTGEDNKYGFIANTQSIAMTKTDLTAIEKYFVGVGVHDDPIIDTSNLNRTILKITNTNQQEPIKAKAYYDAIEEKIKIEVTYRTNAITQILDKKGKILSENSTTADTGDELIGNGTYRYIIIDNLGNMEQISTKVTGLSIYVIPDLETLKNFRDEVNAGNDFKGVTVYQTADIAMNEGKYTINEETGEIIFAENAEQWEPIGKDYGIYFSGTYNGGGYSISGLYINSADNYQGIFGYCYRSGSISNLTLAESSITGSDYVGGIVGFYHSDHVTLEGLKVEKSNIKGEKYVGGIIGDAYNNNYITLRQCSNSATIYGNYDVGGIIARGNYTTIEESYNAGKIIATGSTGGGICGDAYGTTIKNCYNKADIDGAGAAGIAGEGGTNSQIQNCYNIGNINSSKSAAGIGNGSIYNSYNIGNITAKNEAAGIGGNYNSISKCYNEGTINSESDDAGGIGYGIGQIDSSYNKGEVISGIFAGGLNGYLRNGRKTYDSYNVGRINGGYTGGLSGGGYNCYMYNCYNIGELLNGVKSGFYGYADSAYTSNCYHLDTTVTSESEKLTLLEKLDNTTDESGSVVSRGVWKSDIGINNGYPILSWQTDNDKFNLINGDNAFVEDTEGINGGYPILAWQVENSK